MLFPISRNNLRAFITPQTLVWFLLIRSNTKGKQAVPARGRKQWWIPTFFMQSSMYTRSCYSEQSQKQTSSSNTFSQWNSRHCASQRILFIFFFQEAYPAPWSALLTYPASLLCCCWCLLSVPTALSNQGSASSFSPVSQYRFSAHHI